MLVDMWIKIKGEYLYIASDKLDIQPGNTEFVFYITEYAFSYLSSVIGIRIFITAHQRGKKTFDGYNLIGRVKQIILLEPVRDFSTSYEFTYSIKCSALSIAYIPIKGT